jgi:hypothetical protein
MIKKAEDFIDELARAALWIEPVSILLIELRTSSASAVNWSVAISPVPGSTCEEFEDFVAKWRHRELQLDWDGVAFDRERRMLTRWVFPPDVADCLLPMP